MSEVEACPHIHRVTDAAADGAECPVKQGASAAAPAVPDLDPAEFEVGEGEAPSLKQYRKLKRVMSSITQFYLTGTQKKLANYEASCEQIANLDVDRDMVQQQLAALSAKPRFNGHPKQLEYKKALQQELDFLEGKRARMAAQRDEFLELHKWSKVINEVCRWLEDNFNNYALETIEGLKGKVQPVELRELTQEQRVLYSRGLDEIRHNLQESQDFFQASVDGRLKIFHDIEAEIVQQQLAVLAKFPADNMRRAAVGAELQEDLAYAKSHDDSSEASLKRRVKMLNNHRAYLKVLKFHTEKLNVLGDLPPLEERVYDPKYTFIAAIGVDEDKKRGAEE